MTLWLWLGIPAGYLAAWYGWALAFCRADWQDGEDAHPVSNFWLAGIWPVTMLIFGGYELLPRMFAHLEGASMPRAERARRREKLARETVRKLEAEASKPGPDLLPGE